MSEHRKGGLGEEAAAFGERATGAAKDAAGSLTGNESLEREGERENAEGNARQEANSVFGTSTGTATSTATGTAAARSRTVTGLFRDRESAENAYRSLHSRGYSKDDVNLLMSDETRKRHFKEEDTDLGSKALEGAGAGAAIGGTTGAILGAIAAIGTQVVLPGVGLVIAGPLAAALAGAGAGGATGGLIGALVGSGIPEDRARVYDEGVRNGGIVMGVNSRTDEDAEYFENEFRTHRGEHVYR
ncbi:MAG TPA: CsbD family protein [Pyrinomonadaceae bacterium]|nr:CsbD family protein [Pyrinomonadaceae bacterium]